MAENHTRKNYSNVEAVDILHQVANLYISTKIPQDYGTGEEYTSVEVHTLKHIADNPGITVTELARDYAKTKGAISQILKKLEPSLCLPPVRPSQRQQGPALPDGKRAPFGPGPPEIRRGQLRRIHGPGAHPVLRGGGGHRVQRHGGLAGSAARGAAEAPGTAETKEEGTEARGRFGNGNVTEHGAEGGFPGQTLLS